MRFNSFVYWGFLAVVVGGVWLFPHRARRFWLLAASYVFYASWHWPFLGLLFGTAAFNHFAARWIMRAADRRRRGAWVIAGNLLLLALFKYLDWLVSNLNLASGVLGLPWQLPVPGWLLPLGVSFYVFHCLSYLIDVIRKREKSYSFIEFQLYLAFFPQLIAGPIMRAREFFPQLRDKLGFDPQKVRSGLWDIACGLFVKTVLADGLAPQVDAAFARHVAALGAWDVWLMAVGFGLQIYFDFSAYTRIAIGSARFCGIELVENFNFPYSASSPVEFWARWHMSLSRWIRDYLFHPLTRGKSALPDLAKAAILSMTLCGLWHGAAWTFVFWGTYHGLLIVGYHVLVRLRSAYNKSERGVARSSQGLLGTAATFASVMLGWALFRSHSVGQALALMERALTPWAHGWRALSGTFYLHVVLLVLLVWLAPLGHRVAAKLAQRFNQERLLPSLMAATGEGVLVGCLLALVLIYLHGQTAFIYFQF